jgi:hypothetical protein
MQFAHQVDRLTHFAQVCAGINWLILFTIGILLIRKRSNNRLILINTIFIAAGVEFLCGIIVIYARIQFFQLICIQTSISPNGGLFSTDLAKLNIIEMFPATISPFIIAGIDLIVGAAFRFYHSLHLYENQTVS